MTRLRGQGATAVQTASPVQCTQHRQEVGNGLSAATAYKLLCVVIRHGTASIRPKRAPALKSTTTRYGASSILWDSQCLASPDIRGTYAHLCTLRPDTVLHNQRDPFTTGWSFLRETHVCRLFISPEKKRSTMKMTTPSRQKGYL